MSETKESQFKFPLTQPEEKPKILSAEETSKVSFTVFKHQKQIAIGTYTVLDQEIHTENQEARFKYPKLTGLFHQIRRNHDNSLNETIHNNMESILQESGFSSSDYSEPSLPKTLSRKFINSRNVSQTFNACIYLIMNDPKLCQVQACKTPLLYNLIYSLNLPT